MLSKENFVLILGAGITGLSAINYLKGKKKF
jgi:UDP-N-acetylmuramoylalanine-D-glutamate ligase